MDEKNSPIDPKEIEIKIVQLDPPDYRLDYEIPKKLTKRIYKKLKKGGYDYNQQQMVALLTNICISEGMNRLDKKSIWGPKPLKDAEIPLFSKDKSFVFSSVVDTYSAEDISEIESIPINRINIEITDELIDAELYEQRLEIGTRQQHSGTLDHGDEIVCSVTLTIESEEQPLSTIDNCRIRIPRLGENTVVGKFQFADATEQLHGLQPSGTACIPVSIPANYPDKQLHGKQAQLKIDVKSAERITPASIEDVLKQYGTPNETILRSQINLSLKSNFEQENNTLMLNQMYSHLGDILDLQIPQRIIDTLFEDMCKKVTKEELDGEDLTEDRKEKIQQRAVLSTRRRAITARMSDFLDLMIGEQDIERQIRAIAERRHVRPEDIRAEFVSEDKINQLGNMSMEQKIFNKLKSKMAFTESTFSNLPT